MSRLKRLIKKIDKIVENISIEEIEERIKADEMEEDIKVLEEKIKLDKSDYEKEATTFYFDIDMIPLIENLIKRNKELEEKVNKYEKQIDLEWVEENYIEKSKVKEARNKFDEMVQKMYARKKEITDHDVFILFDKLLEGDDK